MVGPLSQLIALMAHGTAYLRDGIEVEHFYPHNQTFIFCNSVSFVDVEQTATEVRTVELARDPVAWFHYLRGLGCQGLKLSYKPTPQPRTPEHKLAGFVGGGGQWHMVALMPRHADYWAARWEVSDRDAPDRRLWRVLYGRVAKTQPLPPLAAPDLPARKAALRQTLTEIEAFARRHREDYFADCFLRALELLDADQPVKGMDDLLPPAFLSLDARQLLAATSAAWVFGGMGSWNDLAFEGAGEDEQYERLSTKLYADINSCLEQSINSHDQEAEHTTVRARTIRSLLDG